MNLSETKFMTPTKPNKTRHGRVCSPPCALRSAKNAEVSDATKQRTTVLDQGRRWLNADREAATKWILTSETLPEEWRAELLKVKK